jgi:carotenoid cleavage dioxygenase-like enzyme
MATPDYWLGFQSQNNECDDVALSLTGTLPYWLKGWLLRNGPAKYEAGSQKLNHWFDGFAKLHKFVFESEKVRYSSSFIRSKAYVQAQKQGKIVYQEFATNPETAFWQKVVSLFSPNLTDNPNVNVCKLGERRLALTETSFVTRFDLAPLHTLGRLQFEDKLSAPITTAHPQYDFAHTTMYNLLVNVGKTNKYMVYCIKHDTRKRELLATIPVAAPGYTHSFAMSESYIILVEFPLLLNVWELVFSGKPYIENYHWQADKPTRFYVINKHDGTLVATMESEACFAFHHVNAFEKGNEIVLDVATYKDAAIVQALYLDKLQNASAPFPAAELSRFILNLNSKQVKQEKLSARFLELPTIHYHAVNGRDYKYIYGASPAAPGDFLNQLVKVEIGGGEIIWKEDNCFPGEPVFIADPHKDGEDDGVVVSVVLNGKQGQSFLLVLDAKNMQEIARAQIPQVVPFGFHGQFLRSYSTEV